MNRQEAEKILWQLPGLNRAIRSVRQQIQTVEQEAQDLSKALGCMRLGCASREQRAQQSGQETRQAQALCLQRYARLHQRLQQLCARREALETWVEMAWLTQQEYEYVRLRYWQGLSAANVARRIGYSPRQCNRLRERSLYKLSRTQVALCVPSDAPHGESVKGME